jgi:hypothetical protein
VFLGKVTPRGGTGLKTGGIEKGRIILFDRYVIQQGGLNVSSSIHREERRDRLVKRER